MQRYVHNLAVDVLFVLCLTMLTVKNIFLFTKRFHRRHFIAPWTQRKVYDVVVGHEPFASPQLSAISQSTLLGTLSSMQFSITLMILSACSLPSIDMLSSS